MKTDTTVPEEDPLGLYNPRWDWRWYYEETPQRQPAETAAEVAADIKARAAIARLTPEEHTRARQIADVVLHRRFTYPQHVFLAVQVDDAGHTWALDEPSFVAAMKQVAARGGRTTFPTMVFQGGSADMGLEASALIEKRNLAAGRNTR